MYNIIMEHEKLNENFDLYELDSLKNEYIFVAKNDEIKKYMRNIIYYGFSYNLVDNALNFSIEKPNNIRTFICEFISPEIAAFQFEDEDTAFYFKLKYGN